MKQTTIQYKLVMAATGLLLCFFLVIHLLGNLQLLLPAADAKAQYIYDKRPVISPWNSRNMGLLGTVILVFLVIHLKDFWYTSSFTTMSVDQQGYSDMYNVVILIFHQWWYVIIYEISFVALGFHLLHGFFSAARTLGLYHPKYVKLVRYTGWAYTAFITGGFMFIPIYVYFN